MKCELEDTNTNFKPITIKLTVESKDELIALWHRFNVSPTAIREHTTSSYKFDTKPDNDITECIWDIIDNKLKELP